MSEEEKERVQDDIDEFGPAYVDQHTEYKLAETDTVRKEDFIEKVKNHLEDAYIHEGFVRVFKNGKQIFQLSNKQTENEPINAGIDNSDFELYKEVVREILDSPHGRRFYIEGGGMRPWTDAEKDALIEQIDQKRKNRKLR